MTLMTFINDTNDTNVPIRSAVSGLSFGDLPELSRAEEKEAMKTNNNKLANYIDNVRRLQKENAKMIRQIEVSAVKRSIGCTITEKAPTRAFSWLKAPTSAFTFKTLLRHYANQTARPI